MAAPSKLRELRDKINTETDALANVVRDLFHIEKKSHLKYLKAARCYLSKSKKLANIPQAFTPQLDRFIDSTLVDELFNGFIVCFDNKRRLVYKRQATDIFGELICISDNFQTHLGLNAVDALLTYDTIGELTSNNDREYFDELFANPQLYAYPKSLTSYTSWFVSRIKRQNLNTCDYKRFKMTSHYVPSMDAFVGLCTPVLTSANRGELLDKDRSSCFRTVHKSDLKLINAQGDLADFFEFEPQTSLYQMVTPDCLETVAKRHKEVLKNGRGSVDLIKLAAKNDGANVIYCLMNMTMEKREQIVCVYQIMSNEEAKIYQEKSSKFESEIMSSVGTLNTSLSAPTSVEPDFDDDSDDFEDDEADGRSVLVTEAKRGSKRSISATYTHTPKDEPLEEPAQKQTHFTYELNINTQYIPPVIDQTHYSPIVFEAPTSTYEHCKEIDDIVNNLKDVCEQFGKVRDEEESLNLDLNLNFLELSPVAVVEPELQWDEFTWNFDVEQQQQQFNEQCFYLNEVF